MWMPASYPGFCHCLYCRLSEKSLFLSAHNVMRDMQEKKTDAAVPNSNARNKEIVRAALWGIAVNITYALLKGAIGLLSGSIAVFLDAVHNLKDAFSSVIAASGAKLAMKPADRQHPFGYGRIEYLGATVIAILVIIVGVATFAGAVDKIIHPTSTSYSTTMILIMSTGVVAKLCLGIYTLRIGRREHSDSLRGSGFENLFDAVITFATIVSALVMVVWNVDLDSWFAIVISAMLVGAGVRILRSTFGDIIGRSAGRDISLRLENEILHCNGVLAVHSLVLNYYGHGKAVGAATVEVGSGMGAEEIHVLTQNIQYRIEETCGIFLTVGIFARPSDCEYEAVRKSVEDVCKSHVEVRQIEAVGLDRARSTVSVQATVDFAVADRRAFAHSLEKELQTASPRYLFQVTAIYCYCD